MDMDRNLKLALKTGKVYFGAKQAVKAIKAGEAEMIIMAENATGDPDLGNTKVTIYKGTGTELGSACGKPFAISYLTIVDPGKSEFTR